MVAGQPGERLDQRRHRLAGLDGADEGDVGRPDAERVEGGEVGRIPGRAGPEPVVVDAVGDGEDGRLRVQHLLDRLGGGAAHGHDGRRPGDAGRDHLPEEDHLRALVPLGVLEEGEVVDRRHRRDRAAAGGPCSGGRARRRSRAGRPAPVPAAAPRPGGPAGPAARRRGPWRRGASSCQRSASPRRARRWRSHSPSRSSAAASRHGVHAGPGRAGGNGGDVEEEAHRGRV